MEHHQEEPPLAPAEAAQAMGEEVVGLLRTLPDIVQVCVSLCGCGRCVCRVMCLCVSGESAKH